jgi:hypothetical protein
MIFFKSQYAWVAACSLLISCSTSMKTLVLPKGVDKDFRSGEIKYPHLFNSSKVEVLEYRVISDSVKEAARYDTTVTFGVIIPRTSLVIREAESKMVFGTDSLQCMVRYKMTSFQTESQSHSILTDIIVKPDKNDPNYDRNRDNITITPYKRVLSGSIQSLKSNEEMQFWFEHEKAKKDFDSAAIKGYMKYGNDSFFIKPLYKEDFSRGKNAKPMQLLQGYCLMKGDSLVAFLQHAPQIKTVFEPGLKDVLFLNSKNSPAQQLLVAAYFSLVSRVVETTATDPLY